MGGKSVMSNSPFVLTDCLIRTCVDDAEIELALSSESMKSSLSSSSSLDSSESELKN